MTDTRARQAAGDDVVARRREASITAAARGRDELDAEVYHACMDAAAAIEARDAEIARLRVFNGDFVAMIAAIADEVRDLRAALGLDAAYLALPEFVASRARAALAPQPASDGGEA